MTAKQSTRSVRPVSRRVSWWIGAAILVVVGFVWVYPFLWMASASPPLGLSCDFPSHLRMKPDAVAGESAAAAGCSENRFVREFPRLSVQYQHSWMVSREYQESVVVVGRSSGENIGHLTEPVLHYVRSTPWFLLGRHLLQPLAPRPPG